jgi:iron complex outermembrane receptor protein
MDFNFTYPPGRNLAPPRRYVPYAGYVSLALLTVFLVPPPGAYAQTGIIQGAVRSAEHTTALEGANVWMVGTSLSTVTAADGSFSLEQVPTGPQLVKVNLIGYAEATVDVEILEGEVSTLEVTLSAHPIVMDGITVSGSRRLQKAVDAPTSISLVTAQELSRNTLLSYAGALQGARGVDSYRGGVDAVVVNARGFTAAYNYRMRVLVDNKNGQFPTMGAPAGVFFPLVEEDIDRMEVVLGPSSALYGPNAHNGLLHIVTKDPRAHPGTTVVAGAGGNSIFFGRIRHAAASERFAYKVNAEYFTGTDWTKADTAGIDNSGQVYLDDAGEHLERLKATGSLFYFPSQEVQVVGSIGYAKASSPTTMNTGRGYGVDARIDYQEIRLETPRFFAQAYRIGNDAGDTHWIEAKVAAMVTAANAGSPISESEAISQVRAIDKGYRLNYEAQYRDRFLLSGVDLNLIAGVQHEEMRPNTEGTVFTEGRLEPSDPATGQLRLAQTGLYGQFEVDLGERWRLVFAGRYDTHSKYEAQASPRIAVAYRVPERGSFRITYNRAYQAPEIIHLEMLRVAGMVPGTSIPMIVRGNGDGFLLSDSTWIPPLRPERNTTYEVGYKGQVASRLFVDVNLYHSRYGNFLSPLTAITDFETGVSPIAWGDHPLDPWPSQVVLTYRNFGRVNLNGLDVGLAYQLTDRTSAWINYSYMHPVDLEDPANDFDRDGKFDEVSFNAPENKASFGIAVTDLLTTGLNGSFSGRWVQSYDFVSGYHSATEAGKGTGSFQFKDKGPLGGFSTLDLSLSYYVSPQIQLKLSATNILDEGLREAVGSPEIRRLILTEIRYSLR